MLDALHRKLVRELIRLRGQVLTIALVVAAGIASFLALQGAYTSLERAQDAYYDRQRFADVFVQLERAPELLRPELEAAPFVERVSLRIVQSAMLPLDGVPDPVTARVISLPPPEEEQLNAIVLESGRRPEPGRADEVVVLASFAKAHDLLPGDHIPAVINGKRREMRIVGTASSPEYVIAIVPGGVAADPERFAVLWMDPDAVAAAFRMEGAFNDAAFALAPGASEPAAIEAIDRILQPYGGLGAHGRDRQPSNRVLEGELAQLSGMTKVLPAIFLAVAALLVNVVLSRIVHLQRPEIATLKAVGYSNRQIGMHYLEFVLIVVGVGGAIGLGLGEYFGRLVVGLYSEFFRFPDLAFALDVRSALTAVSITLLAAVVGAFQAVRRAVTLAPAEAMRPPAPLTYRRTIADRIGAAKAIGPAVHMVVRELERRPLRTLLSSAAIAAATALTVVGGWYYDGIDALVYTQFNTVMREDAAVTFREPRPERAVHELSKLPGVLAAEGLRIVPVRFRSGHREREASLFGYPAETELRQMRGKSGQAAPLPPDGVVLTEKLAEILEVRPGDAVRLEVLEGQRESRRVVVSGLVDESFGLQGHMRADALERLLGQEPLVTIALLRVDPQLSRVLDSRLKELPYVVDVTRRAALLRNFREQSANMILTTAIIIALFAATITVGVAYNNARIALSMRSRDFASLRVLGFTRAEISAILLGEIAVQVLLALPVGLVCGRLLVMLLASSTDPETYRLPILLTARSYAFAAVVTLVAALFSALLVRRRIDRLDLIGVLKTRE